MTIVKKRKCRSIRVLTTGEFFQIHLFNETHFINQIMHRIASAIAFYPAKYHLFHALLIYTVKEYLLH